MLERSPRHPGRWKNEAEQTKSQTKSQSTDYQYSTQQRSWAVPRLLSHHRRNGGGQRSDPPAACAAPELHTEPLQELLISSVLSRTFSSISGKYLWIRAAYHELQGQIQKQVDAGILETRVCTNLTKPGTSVPDSFNLFQFISMLQRHWHARSSGVRLLFQSRIIWSIGRSFGSSVTRASLLSKKQGAPWAPQIWVIERLQKTWAVSVLCVWQFKRWPTSKRSLELQSNEIQAPPEANPRPTFAERQKTIELLQASCRKKITWRQGSRMSYSQTPH